MTAFSQRDVALEFVERRRAAIPYGADQISIMLRLAEVFTPSPRRIIDLGCGDGILANALLNKFPNTTAILIDQSPPMLEKAKEALRQFGERVDFIHGDLNQSLNSMIERQDGADIVVSGYAIHHLIHTRKRSLYSEVYELLSANGVFINIEHVESPDSELEQIWDDAYIEHIATIQGVTRGQAYAEYHVRPDKADNILAPVETQLRWLREIGFSHVDCYFKWFELAVFGGQKRSNQTGAYTSHTY